MRCSLFAFVFLAACGRCQFDEIGGDARADGVGDGAPAIPVRIHPVGGAGGQYVHDVAFGPDGAVAVTGYFDTMAALGTTSVSSTASGGDLFLGVLESTGAARWLVTLGVTTLGSGQNVVWQGDRVIGGGYFAGTTSQLGPLSSGAGQDIVLLDHAADGTAREATSHGGSANVQLRALAVSAAGRLAIGGVYAGSPSLFGVALPASATDSGFALAGLPDAPVERAWLSSTELFVNDLAFDAAGALCVTGRFLGTVDFGAGPVSAGASSTFVGMYEPDLGYRWVRTFAAGATAAGVTATADGDCIATGHWSGGLAIDGLSATPVGQSDVYVIRFEGATGTARWLQTAGGPGDDKVFAIEAIASDRIAVFGRMEGASSLVGMPVVSEGANDGYLLVLDGAGDLVRVERLGGAGTVTNSLGGMSADASGTRLALGVGFAGELRVRDQVATAAADDDAAVIILSLDP